MVAHVLRLRLALLVGSLNARPAVLVRRFAGFTVLAVAVAAVCIAVVRLDRVSDDVAATLTTVLGSAIVIGFLLVPLFIGADDPLDPRRFLVTGSDPRSVALSAVVASFASVPALATAAVAVAMAVAWVGHGAPVVLAVLGAILFTVTCVVGARCAMAVAAVALRDRRSPQLTGLMITAAGIVVFPAAVFLVSLEWSEGVPSQLTEAADVLALTPLGASSALALRGGAAGVASALVGAATVLGLLGIWMLLVRRMMTATERPVPVRERRGLGWFAVMPGLPGGAIAARSIVYWFGDPRHLANLVIVPIASVLIVVPLLIVGVPVQTVALIPAPVLALFLGWLAHNDLAYDSTGVWLHISAGVRGVADRVGRLVPVVFVGVPLLAVAITVSVWLHDRWAILPAMVGVCIALFLSGLGLSSISSVVAPYAVSRPGEGPFEQPQRTGGTLAQAAVLLGAVVLSVPSLWWGWQALTGDPSAVWQSFWAGIVIGGMTLLIGVFIGGVAFVRRSSRIMEFAETL
ncbi:hypothetical protein KZX37_10815 [Microbacterium sp. EYE_5]|uniref:hypothetical protein n=1 Tax=unclassified Microbacterium TaxID=2609290 RepID=UPI00200554FD|nr:MULTISPECIES: hypothetical protein [unclassified Microbacterium]MCK6080994.1 hypothetical protein [Microbacterium sp. EYE_382]MCK6086264.1 hypothetical protein [Microbacterium sp. EYE_384]MCK6124238.1 hypothetical protein [Microbacterium sp. EYE_80]MCK6127147.1 hypothetical protein [Microbacterium sp. EYE_79]MCK6141949.1 hypothetical protein [Microbacterium sp. EYE_39]